WFFAMDLPILLAAGSKDVAAGYAVAMRFLIMLIAIPDALAALYYPAFSRKAVDSYADQAAALLTRLRLGLLFGFPTAVGATVLADPITALIARDAYAGAAPALAALTWLLLIETLSRTLGVFLRAHSLQKESMYIRVGCTLLKFGLAVPVVKAAGVNGLLVLSLGSAAVCALATFYFVNTVLPLRTIVRDVISAFLRPAAAATAMGALLWTISGYSLAVTVPAGVVTFGAAAFGLRAFPRNDGLVVLRAMGFRIRKERS
ncbi:MAG: polysaccharide biosynthesis C-terminal domain-containing protein, partial [Candidatus Hydrogenedentes bacterium]|nr:polysaccharide biosynthesis C-terminal domain-containing protein [Candidatus Hydrogenedentota bacterium]